MVAHEVRHAILHRARPPQPLHYLRCHFGPLIGMAVVGHLAVRRNRETSRLGNIVQQRTEGEGLLQPRGSIDSISRVWR